LEEGELGSKYNLWMVSSHGVIVLESQGKGYGVPAPRSQLVSGDVGMRDEASWFPSVF